MESKGRQKKFIFGNFEFFDSKCTLLHNQRTVNYLVILYKALIVENVQVLLKCLAPVANTTSTIGKLAFFLSTADHLLTCHNCVNETDKNIGSYKINNKFISVRFICNNKQILTITLKFLRANLVLESRINVPCSTNFGST